MPERTGVGPGDILRFVYALFVVAAGARSAVQIIANFDRAPVAYTLSALAAVIYAGGYLALRRATPGHVRPAQIWCGIELAGVVAVGTLSLGCRELFPEPSVWSTFGAGYGFVPLVLPALALVWLRSGVPARM